MYVLHDERIHAENSKLAQYFLHRPSCLNQLWIGSIGVCQLDVCM